ncbi:hypothetical protein Pmi06nite_12170 [Planotetraspora mira]|uniref:Uncharacterized protein n=1 Tax=Planotetraspora mira TaxID=58121 RepID=A0A8J3TIH2_9ACTN|nr:hypothetical protein Pmi06nite_12170 [Planotetraspora mira]
MTVIGDGPPGRRQVRVDPMPPDDVPGAASTRSNEKVRPSNAYVGLSCESKEPTIVQTLWIIDG